MIEETIKTLWHPIKNTFAHDVLSIRSHKKAWWQCALGHEWESPIREFSGKCPFCINRRVLPGFNDLATTHPQLLKEWDVKKNQDIFPQEILAGTERKAWWLCHSYSHSWQVSPKARLRGEGCPFCTNRRVLPGFNDLATTHPQLLKEWSDKNISFPSCFTAGSKEKIIWICTENHEWEAPIYRRAKQNTRCAYCKNKVEHELVIESAIGKELDTIKNINYQNIKMGNSQLLWWVCEQGHSWRASPKQRFLGQTCNICAGIVLLPGFNDLGTKFPELIEFWSEENSLSFSSVLAFNRKDLFKWKGECGHEWEAKIWNMNRSLVKCPFCSNRTILAHFNDLATTHPELAHEWHPNKNSFLPNEIGAQYAKKVWWKGSCGHEWEQSVSHRSKRLQKCPYCSNQKVMKGYNDLLTAYPELKNLWSDKNNISPEEVSNRSSRKYWIYCPKGHENKVSPEQMFYQKEWCKVCMNRELYSGFNDFAFKNPEYINTWNFSKNSLAPENVIFNSRKKVWWICSKGHEWEKSPYHRVQSPSCPECLAKSFSSRAEQEILDSLVNHIPNLNFKTNERSILPKAEIDIFFPKEKVGIEYNGVFWHSLNFKGSRYHLSKFQKSYQAGVDLIQVIESDYLFNKGEIIKRLIGHVTYKTNLNPLLLRESVLKGKTLEFVLNKKLIGKAKVYSEDTIIIKDLIWYSDLDSILNSIFHIFGKLTLIEQNNFWPIPRDAVAEWLICQESIEPKIFIAQVKTQDFKIWDAGQTIFRLNPKKT